MVFGVIGNGQAAESLTLRIALKHIRRPDALGCIVDISKAATGGAASAPG
jgi:hypothetical protein